MHVFGNISLPLAENSGAGDLLRQLKRLMADAFGILELSIIAAKCSRSTTAD